MLALPSGHDDVVEARFDPRRILKEVLVHQGQTAMRVEARFDPRRILKGAGRGHGVGRCGG